MSTRLSEASGLVKSPSGCVVVFEVKSSGVVSFGDVVR